jgi:hypothetical protein
VVSTLQTPAAISLPAKKKKKKAKRATQGDRLETTTKNATVGGSSPVSQAMPFSASCAKGLTKTGYISEAFARRLALTSADRTNERSVHELTFRLYHLMRALPASHQGDTALVVNDASATQNGKGGNKGPSAIGSTSPLPATASIAPPPRRKRSFRPPSQDFFPSIHPEDAQTLCEGLYAAERGGFPVIPLEVLERGGCNEGSFTPPVSSPSNGGDGEDEESSKDDKATEGDSSANEQDYYYSVPSTSFFNPVGFTYLSEHDPYSASGPWCSGRWNASVFIGEVECGFLAIHSADGKEEGTEWGVSVVSATGGIMSHRYSRDYPSARELLLASGSKRPVEHFDHLATAGYCDKGSCNDPGAFVTDVLPKLLHLDAFLPKAIPLLWPSGEFPRRVLAALRGDEEADGRMADKAKKNSKSEPTLSIFAGMLNKDRRIIFHPEGGLLRARRLFFYGSLDPLVSTGTTGSPTTWLSQRLMIERFRERLQANREERNEEEAKRRSNQSQAPREKKRIVVFADTAVSDDAGDSSAKVLVRALEETFGRRSPWRKDHEQHDIRLLSSALLDDETARLVYSADIVIARHGLGAALGVVFSSPRSSLVEVGTTPTTPEDLALSLDTPAAAGEDHSSPFPQPRYTCFTRNAGNNYCSLSLELPLRLRMGRLPSRLLSSCHRRSTSTRR